MRILFAVTNGPTESPAAFNQAVCRIMAEELENELAKHMLVDWADRDSLRAMMRNTARIIFRKFPDPSMIRDEAVSRIIDSLAKNQKDRHTR